jgi:hypothetical protein
MREKGAMMITQTEPEAESIPENAESDVRVRHRRHRERNEKVASSHRWMRVIYFALASAWGFLCGSLGLAAVLSVDGRVIAVENPVLLLLLIPVLAVALLGSLVAASAYREARRRMR